MSAVSPDKASTVGFGWPTMALVLLLACVRLCHVGLLWADEDYHLAAAINLLHGKVPYRDFWYDKPPLSAFYYLLIAGHAGWALRLLDAGYILLACSLIYGLARDWWGVIEGRVAALLLAFFTTFYLPSAVIPFAADAIMLVPHLAAVYCAHRRWALRAGLCAGLAFLANTKAIFVLVVCAVWLWPAVFPLAFGFLIPPAAVLTAALPLHALEPYYEQVWRWGVLYAEGSPVHHPLANGFSRTLNWLGFHAFLVVTGCYAFARVISGDRWKLGAWVFLSFAGTALGARFAPHYFLQLLPSLVVLAARGSVLIFRRHERWGIAAGALLLMLPLIRFGPHYGELLLDEVRDRRPQWSDVVMDLDSRQAASFVNRFAHSSETLFVWGYRPDIYVYTRLVSDSRFWDSQPLTGVPADRHLSRTDSIYGTTAATNRLELIRSRPTFLVDGLSLLNPGLSPGRYPELLPWLAHYKLIGRTNLTFIYRRLD